MKIDSVSFAVSEKVVKNFAMSVSRIRGMKNAVNDRYLLLYDVRYVAEITGAPKRAYPIYGTAPFDVLLADEQLDFLNGCVAVVSSTDATYTASAETVDLFVTGVSHIDDTGWVVAGDYTTAAETLQVWADASGPKKLMRIEVSDAGSPFGDNFYVQIHAGDTPATDKIVQSLPVVTGTPVDFFFGNGFVPQRDIAGVMFDGCTIALSSTQSTYNALGANVDYIRATHV